MKAIQAMQQTPPPIVSPPSESNEGPIDVDEDGPATKSFVEKQVDETVSENNGFQSPPTALHPLGKRASNPPSGSN